MTKIYGTGEGPDATQNDDSDSQDSDSSSQDRDLDKERDEFSNLLKRRQEKDSDKKKFAREEAMQLAAGDQILRGLLGGGASAEADKKQRSSIGDRISEIAQRLADRILVSDPSKTGDSEVRIHLRDAVLQGSEITFRHDQGQLIVAFNVPTSGMQDQLLQQTGNLQQQLETRLHENVRVEVNVQADSSGSQGEGRSRNQRDIIDEWDPDGGQGR